MRTFLRMAVVLLHRRVVDRHAGIIDGLVHDPERVRLRRPLKVVDGGRPIALTGGIDLVDRDDLALFWLGDHFLVVKAPPGGRVAAEGLAGKLRVGAGPRLHVHDAHFKDVAGLRPAHVDRAGANVHAETFARATAQELAVDRASAAAVHTLLVLDPQEDAFGARIALDHAVGIVVGVVRERLDGDVVAGVDLEARLEDLAEVSPMDGLGGCRKVMVGGTAAAGDCHRCDKAVSPPVSAAAPLVAAKAPRRKLRRSASSSCISCWR
jgi:hypothetical protein